MQIDLTEEECRDLIECEENSWSEGQTGLPERLLRMIFKELAGLRQEYPYLVPKDM